MADAKALTVREISAAEAAARLDGLEQLDPTGTAPDTLSITQNGRAFAIEGEAADAVFVVAVRNGCAFITAAKGGGSVDVTELIDRVVTSQAFGLESIGCQTARPGLVRKLERRGWRVAGWILKKALT